MESVQEKLTARVMVKIKGILVEKREVLHSVHENASVFYFFVFALFAIWVAADSSSFGSGLFVLFFWPISYPWYLIVRNSCSETSQLPQRVDESITEWLDRGPSVDEMFSKAVNLDQRGDWEDALGIYEHIAAKGGQDGEYASNCAQDVRAKMKMSQ